MKSTTLVLALLASSIGCRFGEPSPSYSDGYRVGVIEKFSRKGFVFKSWEGRMILQGYTRDGDGNLVVRSFPFSVLPQHQAIAAQIEAAMSSGSPVRVHYRQDWMGQVRYSSSYFVDAVEAAK